MLNSIPLASLLLGRDACKKFAEAHRIMADACRQFAEDVEKIIAEEDRWISP